ncbi:MAG: GlxA family transcriptional regulator [Sphingorhabdus sp.]
MEAEPLADLAQAPMHTLFVPGAEREALEAALADVRLRDWLQAVAPKVPRLASVCSGSVLLGAFGLLDGRRATTHWRGLDALGERAPAISVDRSTLFVEDGRVLTSAGVTAGIDVALAMVARDLGRAAAMAVAREMVLFLVRSGGQTQFSAPLALQARASGSDLHALPAWIEAGIAQPLPTAAMGEGMSMSERTFYRRCTAVFGMTPLALVQELRLERARSLLEDPSTPTKTVAADGGLGDASAMGKLFKARFGVTPSDYRDRFAR